jgi:hypothetical protein
MKPSRLFYGVQSRNVAVVLLVAAVLAGCVYPPPDVAPKQIIDCPTPTATVTPPEPAPKQIIDCPTPTATATPPEPVPEEWGVAVSAKGPGNETDLRLLPVTTAYAARSYAAFGEACNDDADCKKLLNENGRVEYALIVPEAGPTELVFAEPGAGLVVTPTAWSEYTRFDGPPTDNGALVDELYLETIPITVTVPYTPTGAFGPSIDASLLELSQVIALEEIDQMLLRVDTETGPQYSLVVIGPGSGDSCVWMYHSCRRCRKCGFGGVCRVLRHFCGF